MSGSSHAGEKVEPNMTPILDMVFQLITFFMLVISFRASDFDKALVLPVVGSAAPAEEEVNGEFLILNLRAGGKLMVQGKEEPNIEGFLNFEAKKMLQNIKPDSGGEIIVVIRADRALRCDFLMRVIAACRKGGLSRFDFMVLRGGEQQSG
ncbi:MAG: biopolymer transporter ExbD [Pirellulaceae bacterium]|nr:biopolymer transporter ExbD [Pirellulaceae bacterium]